MLSSVIRRAAVALAALALALGLAALAAPGAGASPVPARASQVAGSIFGPCTALQDGQIRKFGSGRYICVYVWGLGYYWVSYSNYCTGAATAARETAASC